MESLEYKAKNGKTYAITMERVRGRKDSLYGFSFKINREGKTFSYTLVVASTIVTNENWSQEKIAEHTLKKAQNLLDEGREQKIKKLFIRIIIGDRIVGKWMPL